MVIYFSPFTTAWGKYTTENEDNFYPIILEGKIII